MKTGLYWFNTDLRLEDNVSLLELLNRSERVAFVYVIDPRWFRPLHFHQPRMAPHRWLFLKQSLSDLHQSLQRKGHALSVLVGDPVVEITRHLQKWDVSVLGCARPSGLIEAQQLKALSAEVPRVIANTDLTLFDAAQIEQDSPKLTSFSQFRRYIESSDLAVASPCASHSLELASVATTDSIDDIFTQIEQKYPQLGAVTSGVFNSGYGAAQLHLTNYFTTSNPLRYKATRNALDRWDASTKLSPYLASGILSARQVWSAIEGFERAFTANESTYWIRFELLWREYFHQLAIRDGAKLFKFQGRAATRPLTYFNAIRFAQWSSGSTEFPLVNACMNQLRETGYISNRARQIVASCLVNELACDWRFGAAYFEQYLVDYDVAANWGNWQYIAGVGADTRGGRHFDLAKQTEIYDPDGTYRTKWLGGESHFVAPWVDAVDWPIDPSQ
ncbi:DASH family cryptochrome [Umboniibacter marinipuniceus]|uniref:Cryptochrome DASH n=1 Tax=Umboniibacter marinipuniceus TaxID=569599 RepID=A0A3M0A746_9GAMM|nr:DASH family cryptochrome [Umboniibacter marinipuniceus]RMA80971.1 deoxyribodipyrimidine photo-lyase (single-stranded DNA-specific) [Umboniibacter marinipuniceus]